MRRVLLALVCALVAASCSGVSQEEHDALLEESSALRQERDSLEQEVSELEGQLDTASEEVDGLQSELATAEEALSEAEELNETLASAPEAPNLPAAILVSVLARGEVRCGIGGSLSGFSELKANGSVVGFDAEFCRAVAAAVLGDSEAVEFIPVPAGQRWAAVRTGQVDVMFRNTTWTLKRDAALGEQVDFGPTTFYDGQQFMGSSAAWETSSDGGDLDGASVCVTENSPAADAASEYAAAFGASPEMNVVVDLADGLSDSRCDLITGEGTFLSHLRSSAIAEGEVGAGDLVIFPTVPITREPLGPVYIQGDTVWADIVDWVVFTTIIADEKQLTSANLDNVEWDTEARRLLGAEGEYATTLGLDSDAFYQVIKQVGSYSEIFERTLEPLGYRATPGFNAIYAAGGLLYAPPAR